MNRSRRAPAWTLLLTAMWALALPLGCGEKTEPSESPPGVLINAENPIGRIPDPEIRALLASDDPDERIEGMVMMEVERELALDVLEYIWDQDTHPQVREFLLDEVAEEGGDRAAAFLVRAALEARDPYVRDDAFHYLTIPEFNPHVPLEAMVTFLKRTDLKPEFRSVALHVLYKQGTPEAVAVLKDVVREDPEPDLREVGARLIGMLGDPKSIPFVEQQLESEKDYRVRLALKEAITALRQPPDGTEGKDGGDPS